MADNKKEVERATINTILYFIYQVRCNIFHGVKSIPEMKSIKQQERLEVYTSIIIALNQMVFSYLDYLCEREAFVESFDRLHKVLSQQ